MANPSDKTAREERLAAKLRENLKRRKAQARSLAAAAAAPETPAPLSKPDSSG